MDAELTRWTGKTDWVPKFLEVLRNTGIVRRACECAAISRQTAYTRRTKDQTFADEWDTAVQDAIDHVEAVAWQRAKDGLSDTLIIFLLKSRRREVYGERIGLEHSGPGGIPIQTQAVIDTTRLSTEELETLDRLLGKASSGQG